MAWKCLRRTLEFRHNARNATLSQTLLRVHALLRSGITFGCSLFALTDFRQCLLRHHFQLPPLL